MFGIIKTKNFMNNKVQKMKCKNCGFDSHCDQPLRRPEQQWQDPDTLHAWTIEVCKICRCEECND